MKKQHETRALQQLIDKAEIHQTLDLLERQLHLYRQSGRAKKNLYQIHQEFDAINNQFSDLKFRIKDLMKED